MRIKWNQSQVEREVENLVERRMMKAVIFLEGQAKSLVSRGNRTGKNPSKPFEPPKVVSGTLRANIGHAIRKAPKMIVGAIGVRKGNADKYALRLELGFQGTDSKGRRYNQLKRPYLVATLKKHGRKAGNIIRKG